MRGLDERYQALTHALRGERLPAALVDLEAVDANVDRIAAVMRASGKTLRVATKSLRCRALLEHVLARAPDVFRGVMAYAAEEARFLFDQGIDDLLLAYPTVQSPDLQTLSTLAARGARIAVVVDAAEHVAALATAARGQGTAVTVVVDVDASLRPLRGALHVGVRRSPLHEPGAVVALARLVQATEGVRFGGVMAYEAQIAGLNDQSPHRPALNPAKAALRRLSRGPVERLRRAVREALEAEGLQIPLFNGGGTGSLAWASLEPGLTELTAGSGFLAPHLFDAYTGLDLVPALFFALQVVRRPAPGFVTCAGGGFVASGEAGADRLPQPYLPAGLRLLGVEGAGEVQTPLRVPRELALALGAPVLFRPAKAGELAERFSTYLFVRGGEVVARTATYRGEGRCFL